MEESRRHVFLNYFGWFFVALLLLMLAIGFSRKGIYSSVLGLNLVVVGDTGVSLMLIRPQESLMTWVRLPNNLSIKIVDSEAVYPLESVWKYGVMEKNPYKLMTYSLSNSIGVLLPRVVKIDGAATPENLLGSLHKLSLHTDLSIRDRFLLRRDLVTNVSSKRFLEIDIPKTAMTKAQDPDGMEFLEVNSVINLWTKNKFVFDALLGENANVKIFNLSQVKGAGLLVSRQLESSGLRVVEVSSKYDGSVAGKGCVFSSAENLGTTVYLLEKFAGCKKIEAKNEKQKGEGIEIWLL